MQSDWKLYFQARISIGEFYFIACVCVFFFLIEKKNIPTLRLCWKAKRQTTIHACQPRSRHAGVDAVMCLVTKKPLVNTQLSLCVKWDASTRMPSVASQTKLIHFHATTL